MRDARTCLFPSARARIARLGLLAGIAGLALLPPRAGAEVRTPPAREVRAWQTGLLRADRIEHASLSWSLGLAVGLASREPAIALGGVAAAGVAKEISDRHRTGFDLTDLAADLIGGCGAAAVTTLWRR